VGQFFAAHGSPGRSVLLTKSGAIISQRPYSPRRGRLILRASRVTPAMTPRSDSAAPAAASVDDGGPAQSEESDDDEEAESEEQAAPSSPPQQASNDEDSFTTLLFSDRGTTLPVWTLETDDEFNQLVRQRKQLPVISRRWTLPSC
jgi:hypothetical protein